MYGNTHTCMEIHTYACMEIHTDIHYTQIYTCMEIHTLTCIERTHDCTHACTYTRKHTHTDTHAHTHALCTQTWKAMYMSMHTHGCVCVRERESECKTNSEISVAEIAMYSHSPVFCFSKVMLPGYLNVSSMQAVGVEPTLNAQQAVICDHKLNVHWCGKKRTHSTHLHKIVASLVTQL